MAKVIDIKKTQNISITNSQQLEISSIMSTYDAGEVPPARLGAQVLQAKILL